MSLLMVRVRGKNQMAFWAFHEAESLQMDFCNIYTACAVVAGPRSCAPSSPFCHLLLLPNSLPINPVPIVASLTDPRSTLNTFVGKAVLEAEGILQRHSTRLCCGQKRRLLGHA
jgi:hypothetical protein